MGASGIHRSVTARARWTISFGSWAASNPSNAATMAGYQVSRRVSCRRRVGCQIKKVSHDFRYSLVAEDIQEGDARCADGQVRHDR